MQKASCKEILQTNKDIVLLSPTGTGKTYAYLIPLVQLVDVQSDNVQAVVLVPSRELAKQTMNVVTEMKCGVRAMALYGGRSTMDEHRLIPVSYTHLDVYKRQVGIQHAARIWGDLHGMASALPGGLNPDNRGSLLYTSRCV